MRQLKNILFKYICVVTFGMFQSWSQASVTTQTALSPAKSAGAMSTYVGLTAATNLKAQGSEKTWNSSLTLIPSYRFKNNHVYSLLLSGYKNFTGEREQELTTAQLRLSLPSVHLKNKLVLGPQIRLQLPVTEDQIRRQGLKSSISGQLAVIVSDKILRVKDLSLTYIPRGTKSFHSREVSTIGSSNNEYSLSHLIAVGYDARKKISVSLSAMYITGWTYQGNIREQFYIAEEVSWQINQKMGVALGHSNQGGVRSANGEDSNINVYDPNNSEVYSSISYRF